ncbi:MAG: hypothetical protein KC668_30750, partial [Myxococcales bacterium]|nr:hypothetical protein [Myxococcales bacterium]
DGETYENSCMAGTVGVSVAHPGPCGCLCELIYDPVCGDDGETYANSCLAECAGAAVDHDGTCSGQCSFDGECGDGEFCDHSGACDGDTDPGHCAVKPMICTGEVDEVCGCDGVTYGNACEANAEGMGVAAEGPCDVMEDDEDVIIIND